MGAIGFTLAVGILGSTCAAWRGRPSTAFRLANAFAAGEFIGVAMLHLLWEANVAMGRVVAAAVSYPIAPAIFVATLLLTMFAHRVYTPPAASRPRQRKSMERGGDTDVESLCHDATPPRPGSGAASLGGLFTLILAVHSLFGGLVIGLQTALHATIINFIAFGTHKGVAAYALGLDLSRADMSGRWRLVNCLVFAVSTPVGVAAGAGTLAVVPHRVGVAVSAAFGAASAGSFMYIAVRELAEELAAGGGTDHEGSDKDRDNGTAKGSAAPARPVWVALAAIAGVAVMAIVFPVIIFPGTSGHAAVGCVNTTSQA